MAKNSATFELELPDYFIYDGKTYDPGTHVFEKESVYNDLKGAVARYNEAKRKEAEEEAKRMEALNVTGLSKDLGISDGLSMDAIQQLIDQTVEAKTIELSAKIEEQQERILELESYVSDDSDADPSNDPPSEEPK